jgi:hypothetical protein
MGKRPNHRAIRSRFRDRRDIECQLRRHQVLDEPAAQGRAAGKAVSMTWDLLLAGLTPTSTITIEIDRGSIGATTVTLYNYFGAQPVAVETVRWAGLSGGLNPKTVNWPARVLLQPAP